MAVTPLTVDPPQAPATRPLAEKLREQRLEAVISEVERIALRLFDDLGFANVTVEDIASESGISVRTFYRYFPTKEDVLQVRLRREARILQEALRARPPDEAPVRSLRVAFGQVVALEDPAHVGRWIRVIAGTPSVLAGVMGGVQLVSNAAIRDFFASRLGVPEDSMVPWIWSAAAGGAIQAAHIHWHLNGGNLAEIIAGGLEILEQGIAASVPVVTSEPAFGKRPRNKRPSARQTATRTKRDLRGAP
jgi:TetR/AcrR family transcriptional regulator, regulator of mycofactocin system